MKLQKAERILAHVENMCHVIGVNAGQKKYSGDSVRNARKGLKRAKRSLAELRADPLTQLLPADFTSSSTITSVDQLRGENGHAFAGYTSEDLLGLVEAYRTKLEAQERLVADFKHAKKQSAHHVRIAETRLKETRKDLRKAKGKVQKAHRVVAKAADALVKKALAAA